MRVDISWVVRLGASHFDLLETPLGKIDSASPEVTTERCMLKPKSRGQSPDLGTIPRCGITDHLNSPVVFLVAHGSVTIR